MSTAVPAPVTPLRALTTALTASPDDAEAWIAVSTSCPGYFIY